MRGAIRPLPQYVFIAQCFVKHRDKFAFHWSAEMYCGWLTSSPIRNIHVRNTGSVASSEFATGLLYVTEIGESRRKHIKGC
jgi:hypothetical protein